MRTNGGLNHLQVLETVVDSKTANLVNGRDLKNHSWDYAANQFDPIETVVILLTDKSFLTTQNIERKELDLTCAELGSKPPQEKTRLESLLVDNVNHIEKFSRPFYEWVELRGDRLVNGLGKTHPPPIHNVRPRFCS